MGLKNQTLKIVDYNELMPAINDTKFILIIAVPALLQTSALAVDQQTRQRWNQQENEFAEIYKLKSQPGKYKIPYGSHPFRPFVSFPSTLVRADDDQPVQSENSKRIKIKERRISPREASKILTGRFQLYKNSLERFQKVKSSELKVKLSYTILELSPFNDAKTRSSSNPSEPVQDVVLEAFKRSSELEFLVELVKGKPESSNYRELAIWLFKNRGLKSLWFKLKPGDEGSPSDLQSFEDEYNELRSEISANRKYRRFLGYVKLIDREAYKSLNRGFDTRIASINRRIASLCDRLSGHIRKDTNPGFLPLESSQRI